MQNSLNLWVDGSLWNHEWYEQRFSEIREKFPHYRIAILAVTADPSTISNRLKVRAQETGRFIPEQRVRTAALALQESVPRLTRLVDFHARINNDGDKPILEFVEMLNTRGEWDLLKRLSGD